MGSLLGLKFNLLRNKLGIHLLIQVAVINTVLLQTVSQSTPVQSCSDPMLLQHLTTFTHPYCYHACGFLGTNVPTGKALNLNEDINSSRYFQFELASFNISTLPSAVCQENGNCMCRPGCPTNPNLLDWIQPQIPPFDPGLCPSSILGMTDIPSDPEIRTRCQLSCALECPIGGEWRICRDSDPNDLVTVCTCSCPENPFSCLDINKKSLISLVGWKLKLFKLILLALKSKVKTILVFKALGVLLKKFVPLCWFLFKIVGFSLVKYVLIAIYSFGVFKLSYAELKMFFETWGNLVRDEEYNPGYL